MRSIRRSFGGLVVLFAATAALTPATAGAAVEQLRGAAGCITVAAPEGCSEAPGLRGPEAMALSPDGRQLYTAGRFDSVAVVRRDPATGAVQPGPPCISQPQDEGVIPSNCADGRALSGAEGGDVVVSPDGANVYVSGSDSNGIAVFGRDQDDGALSQLPGAAGCLLGTSAPDRRPAQDTESCASSPRLRIPRSMAISADGKFLYVVNENHGLVAYRRDAAAGGTLTELPGRAGCVDRRARDGCARLSGPARAAVGNAALSPDGRSLYAPGDVLSNYSLDPVSGAIRSGTCIATKRRKGCAREPRLGDPADVALSGDGRSLYIAGFDESKGAVVAFSRNRRTGAVKAVRGTRGCVGGKPARRGKCVRAPGLDGSGADSITVSPSGNGVYVGSLGTSSLVELERRSNGSLAFASCLTNENEPAPRGCSPTARRYSNPQDLVMSPDGAYLYSAADGVEAFRATPPVAVASAKGCLRRARGGEVAARSSQALVYSRGDEGDLDLTYFSCFYRGARVFRLPGQDGGDTQGLGTFRLAGDYLAFTNVNAEEAASTTSEAVVLVNVAERRTIASLGAVPEDAATPDSLGETTSVGSLVIKSSGSIAWIGGIQTDSGVEVFSVQTLTAAPGAEPVELDRSSGIGSRSLRKHFGGELISWTRVGERKEAPFP